MILYGFLGCGIVIALLSGGLWMQTERLDVAQGTIENCEKEKTIIGTQLINQNRAVKGWQNTADERQKQAKAARKEAGIKGQAQVAEIERLKALSAKSCSAAVEGVKKGLKP